MPIQLIELNSIRIDAGTQSRAAINEQTVQEYHEKMEDGIDLPPISVVFDGVNHYIADGFHRYHAHIRSKREMIECEVQNGTVRDAIEYSLSANAKHGLPRTNADKRKAVLTALDDPEWSELSTRQIAQLCAVSHVYVSKVRQELDKLSEKPNTGNVNTKPKTVVEEEPDDKVETFTDDGEAVAELIAENERLQDRLAVEAMDATEEEKTLAQETIESLREEVKSLRVELDAVKRSRDQYQMECSELKKQIKILQRQLKK